MRKIVSTYKTLIMGFVFSFLSCNRYEAITLSKDLSLFAFVVADNDLDDHAGYIENDLVNGLKGCPVGTELFLYLDRQNGVPTLRHMVLSESGKIKFKTISKYDEQCSTSSQVFREVLNTMIIIVSCAVIQPLSRPLLLASHETTYRMY